MWLLHGSVSVNMYYTYLCCWVLVISCNKQKMNQSDHQLPPRDILASSAPTGPHTHPLWTRLLPQVSLGYCGWRPPSHPVPAVPATLWELETHTVLRTITHNHIPRLSCTSEFWEWGYTSQCSVLGVSYVQEIVQLCTRTMAGNVLCDPMFAVRHS